MWIVLYIKRKLVEFYLKFLEFVVDFNSMPYIKWNNINVNMHAIRLTAMTAMTTTTLPLTAKIIIIRVVRRFFSRQIALLLLLPVV